MTDLTPSKIWWTADEIATAALPDLQATKRGVNSHADRCGWRGHPEFARRRAGRGGGWEYHWKLFPLRAQKKLIAEANKVEPLQVGRDDVWQYFETLNDATKQKAQDRLAAIQEVVAFETAGHTRFLAVGEVAELRGVSERTIWNWFAMIEGVSSEDWLAYLAPRHKGAQARKVSGDFHPDWWEILKADFLRLEKPSFASCYRRAKRIAENKKWDLLPERTARRRLETTVPRVTQVFAREGHEGLQRCFPPQTRDRTGMVALEGVNADCHKIDVFVEWPDGTINRPQIVAFQDLYSGKFLSWRIDHTPNKVAVMAAFGDMIDEFGIPQRCLFDNGREFANKWMTAGTKTRFRFKIREDDPLGVLPLLGIQVHWATPGHGQAKPIERGFRDFADDIAKHPRFEGAYVGNRPDAKPENYGSRAIELDEFLRIVDDGIAEHNARQGRLSETANGRSFDETFASSYANAPVRKATEEQRRLWLMGQEVVTMQRSHGLVKIHGNEYWSDWMNEHAGTRVVVRFDPEDLHAGAYIYAASGEFMGFAECKMKVGFFDLTAAKDSARQKAAYRRIESKLRDHHRPLKAKHVAAHLDDITKPEPSPLQAKVVKPSFGGQRNVPLVKRPGYIEQTDPELAAQTKALVVSMQDKKDQRADELAAIEEPLERFKRALEIKRRSAAAQPVGEAEAKWLRGYEMTPEYRGQLRMHESFGDAMFLE